MVDKTFCDKCKTEIKGKRYSLSLWKLKEDEQELDWDLCEKCNDKILTMLNKM